MGRSRSTTRRVLFACCFGVRRCFPEIRSVFPQKEDRLGETAKAKLSGTEKNRGGRAAELRLIIRRPALKW
jgi:hypothetical protein